MVEFQAFFHKIDVAVRQKDFQIGVYEAIHFLASPSAGSVRKQIFELGFLQLRNGFCQNLLVGIEAQVVDEAALVCAQQVPSAPDFQVPKGYFETAAQVRELLQRLQTFAGFVRQGAQRRCQQVAKCFAVASAHAAAHLVQVAQAKAVGLVDDDGVGVGHVQSALNEGGAHQNIKTAFHEGEHQGLQLVALQLAVGNAHAGIRNQTLYHAGHLLNILNAVVDEKDLASARQFVLDGVAYHFFAKAHDVRLNGLPVGGRRGHNAQVSGGKQ